MGPGTDLVNKVMQDKLQQEDQRVQIRSVVDLAKATPKSSMLHDLVQVQFLLNCIILSVSLLRVNYGMQTQLGVKGLKSHRTHRGLKKNRNNIDDVSESGRSYYSDSPSYSVASQSSMSSSLPSYSLRHPGNEPGAMRAAGAVPADALMDDDERSVPGEHDDASLAQMSVMSEDTSLSVGFGAIAENLKNAVLLDSQVASIDDYARVSIN